MNAIDTPGSDWLHKGSIADLIAKTADWRKSFRCMALLFWHVARSRFITSVLPMTYDKRADTCLEGSSHRKATSAKLYQEPVGRQLLRAHGV